MEGNNAMLLGSTAGDDSAVSAGAFFKGMIGSFRKCQEAFSHLGNSIKMLQINLHPFCPVKQSMLREDLLMQNPSLLQTATVKTPLLGLPVPRLSLHFIADVSRLHIFFLSWQLCKLAAGFVPSLPHHHQQRKPNTHHYMQPHDVQIQLFLTFLQLY